MSEWTADNYHRHSSLQQAMAADALARLTLRGDERVLDVGCGDGQVTAQIAARVPRGAVVGVDPSRDMIAFATRHFARRHANLSFNLGDARMLPYQAEFAVVVSFNALHWVHEAEAALRSLRDALQPGGRAQLRFVGRGVRPPLEDVIDAVRRLPRWAPWFEGFETPHAQFTPDQYRGFAEQAGFQVVRLELHDIPWDFGTRDAFFGFCEATFGAWFRRVPEAERSEFFADVLAHYHPIAVERAGEENTFKAYQMEMELRAVDPPRSEAATETQTAAAEAS